MESYMPLTAAQARSIVRRTWKDSERETYQSLFNVVERCIENAAKNRELFVTFKFGEDTNITQAKLLAAELHSEGYGVKLLYLGHRDITQGSQTDLEADSLTIYWGIDFQE